MADLGRGDTMSDLNVMTRCQKCFLEEGFILVSRNEALSRLITIARTKISYLILKVVAVVLARPAKKQALTR